jgi:hypothetical protein
VTDPPDRLLVPERIATSPTAAEAPPVEMDTEEDAPEDADPVLRATEPELTA